MALSFSVAEPPTEAKLSMIDGAFPPKYDRDDKVVDLTGIALRGGTSPLDELSRFLAGPGYRVVALSATWCMPCRRSYASLVKFANGKDSAPVAMLVTDKEILGVDESSRFHTVFGKELTYPSYFIFCNKKSAGPPLDNVSDLSRILRKVSRDNPCEK